MAATMNWNSDEGQYLLRQADLSYDPDPNDVGSWAEEKSDLAALVGHDPHGAALIWYSHDAVVWILATVKVGGCENTGIAPEPVLVVDLGCYVVDPVEALVRARGLWLNG